MTTSIDLLTDLAHGLARKLADTTDDAERADAALMHGEAFGLVVAACGIDRDTADKHVRAFAIEVERELFRLLDLPFDEPAVLAATLPVTSKSKH